MVTGRNAPFAPGKHFLGAIIAAPRSLIAVEISG
jgi:hypothetical protein